MKTFLELYDELNEEPKGLYYNINKKRKEGRAMRKKGEKGAPKASDFERAAQTAKEQLYDRIGPTAKLMKPILVKPKPLGTAPKLGGQTKRGQMVRPKPPKLPESQVADTKAIHVRQNQARRQKQQQDEEAKYQKQREERKQELADKYTDTSSGLELFASGGIASGPPPEKGPQSQGLAYLMKNGKR